MQKKEKRKEEEEARACMAAWYTHQNKQTTRGYVKQLTERSYNTGSSHHNKEHQQARQIWKQNSKAAATTSRQTSGMNLEEQATHPPCAAAINKQVQERMT